LDGGCLDGEWNGLVGPTQLNSYLGVGMAEELGSAETFDWNTYPVTMPTLAVSES
jgi:hypothetical protein